MCHHAFTHSSRTSSRRDRGTLGANLAGYSAKCDETIFSRYFLKREGSLDAAWGSAAAVSSMVELVAVAVGLASAFIFVTHAIEAYRA